MVSSDRLRRHRSDNANCCVPMLLLLNAKSVARGKAIEGRPPNFLTYSCLATSAARVSGSFLRWVWPLLNRECRDQRSSNSTHNSSLLFMTTFPLPAAPRTRSPRKRRRRFSGYVARRFWAPARACPSALIDNAFFSRELGIDTTPEWIESRIGIVAAALGRR